MLQNSTDVLSEETGTAGDGEGKRVHAALGPSVARLCMALEDGDVIAVACGERRGAALARAAATCTEALVLWYPPSDALPGEAAPPSPGVAGQRVAALSALAGREEGRRILLVTDAAAATQFVAPPAAFSAPPLRLAPGDRIDRDALAAELDAIGYFADDRVDEAGEYALRGGAIDIFPAEAEYPVRIHLDDDEVEQIGAYDPVSQLGRGDPLVHLELRPATEPALGTEPAMLFDHLPGAAVALDPETIERRDSFLQLAAESLRGGKVPLAAAGAWRKALAGRARLDLGEDGEMPGPRFIEARRPDRAFRDALRDARAVGDRVVLTGCGRDLRFFTRRLEQAGDEAPRTIADWREIETAEPGAFLALEVEFDRGWSVPGLLVIAAADVLGSRAGVISASAVAASPLDQETFEFHAGDAVIHEDHGLAILRGLDRLVCDGSEGDAFRLEYAGGAQRLVPVEEGARLWRYGADADAVTADKLDGSTWTKRRSELDAALASTAVQLVALAHERDRRTATVLDPPVADYERFAAGFPYGETPDQLRAIDAVRADLASGKPMDRLVVGDVGYGKTEVALRAAAVAALAGRQVVVVAPTTVLVRQHLETFRKRFARIGLKVAGLSRLTSAAEAREVKAGIADGSISILVGTKMVAGKTVRYRDLALIVIDEEQRFGAADKAKLRGLAAEGHVLTLTATPIPRTLQSALVGLQELSLIATPPARRLPTRTQVGEFSPDIVRGALLRERRRGGQSFVVVPRIEDMDAVAAQLAKLVPQLTVRRAHGKMAAAEIDDEMVRFGAGDGDVLLATNIIEAGLDIPRANTMLVWRSDLFGLAQLHQLRGRVGRGRSRGYVMLLTESGASIAPATVKRLRTMEVLDHLGAGFAVSARDLDLRGAGDLLGEEQAGHLKLIGVGLYQHLLEQAIRAARGEDADAWIPELRLGVTGRLPEQWVPEEDVRTNLYLRIARLSSAEEEEGLAAELEDRFGTLPEEASRLLALAHLRRIARETGIARIDAGPAAIALTPRRGTKFAPKSTGLEKKDGRLLLRRETEAGDGRLEAVRDLLEALTP